MTKLKSFKYVSIVFFGLMILLLLLGSVIMFIMPEMTLQKQTIINTSIAYYQLVCGIIVGIAAIIFALEQINISKTQMIMSEEQGKIINQQLILIKEQTDIIKKQNIKFSQISRSLSGIDGHFFKQDNKPDTNL